MASERSLPPGVQVSPLKPHADDRGTFTELFREEWPTGCRAVQWNAVQSRAGVLRGVHVHGDHSDYLVVVSGVLILGLHDIRQNSGFAGWSQTFELDATTPTAVTIPPGVCHGFYFPIASTHIYAVSEYWNARDELGCRFDCAELGLQWPTLSPHLSERDRNAGTYRQMCEAFRDQWAERSGETRP
ncbi:MAG: dTDP-4-dehydrorhamnose 3,5-epimerase family protein [Alphaproteobacteria bacterium]|nr:dTDP-4-dehydrorhamnose 3,5-epimerase family protein [Alphaproteobacteria bacterium]